MKAKRLFESQDINKIYKKSRVKIAVDGLEQQLGSSNSKVIVVHALASEHLLNESLMDLAVLLVLSLIW